MKTLNFFASLNIPIYEGYGLSESTGPHTMNIKNFYKFGSVGLPIHGVMQYIDTDKPGTDGEICMWGRHIFMGYFKNPEATRLAIDKDGYLRSGDVGRIDSDGYLFITGRIKDVIITSGGKNIAPAPIEDSIRNELPFLANVLVIGDKRQYLSALLTVRT
uniref:long-chain-fatty-acid--CoA ligase n=1 Tax=Lygus hesperus TaxID=30085 RepID=A0A0A9X159_LYGHE